VSETETEVALIERPVTAVAVFGTAGGVDAIIARIAAQARAVETDISTPAGRKAVASLAYKISRSKTALDEMGKDLGESNYRAWKTITAERARIEAALDALRDEIRQPLTDWESAEKDRVAAHEAALAGIRETLGFYEIATSDELRRRLAYLENYPSRDWQEFSKRAAEALVGEISYARGALAAAEQREAEAAEAARLAQEKAEQERAAREALVAANARREAEERARAAAEAEAVRVEREMRAAAEKAERERLHAEAERSRIEREKLEAERRAEEAETARLAAIAKAKEDAARAAAKAEADKIAAAEQAAAAERKRIADAEAKEAAEAAAREADRRHRGKINGEARDALVKSGLSEPAATTAIAAVARGAIPHMRISY
jgi:DNA polymerase III gamma/tau subunit